MALETALIPEQQTRLLGCIVCDQSPNPCLCKAIRQRLCVSTAGTSLEQVQASTQLADDLSGYKYTSPCFESKRTAKKSYQKKGRSKVQPTRKASDKVFPEEMLGEMTKEQELSTSESHKREIDSEPSCPPDFMKYNSSTIKPSDRYAHLEDFSDTNGHSSAELLSRVCHIFQSCKPVQTEKCEGQHPFYSDVNNSQKAGRFTSSYNDYKSVRNTGQFVPRNAKNRKYLNIMRRKEQNRLTWKRCPRGSKSQSRRETMSLPNHGHFVSSSQTSSISSQQPAFSGDELSMKSYSSTEPKNAEFVCKTLDTDQAMPYKGVHVNASVESSSQVTEGLSSDFYEVVCTKPTEMDHAMEVANSDAHQTNFVKSKISNKKTTGGPSSKSIKHNQESFPFPKNLQQRHLQCKPKFIMKKKGVDPVQSWTKSPRVKPVKGKNPHHVMNEGWRVSPCLNTNITSRIRHGQEITQKQSSRKWIPVSKNKLSIPKNTVSSAACHRNSDYSPFTDGFDLESNMISIAVIDAPTELESSKLPSNAEMTLLMEQAPVVDCTNFKDECPKKVQHVEQYCKPGYVSDSFLYQFVSSQTAEEALISSYRLQLASENVQQKTGHPLADFERLLLSTTPSLALSDLPKICDGCYHDLHGSPVLCRDQRSNISLHSVWSWYEEPGNYGLKVTVNDLHNKEMGFSERVSFHAHFVPLLSAVQLFGNKQTSSSITNSQEKSLVDRGLEAELQCPSMNPTAMPSLKMSIVGDTLSDAFSSTATNLLSNSDAHGIADHVCAGAPSLFSDAELIFEFFESEQPQRRKPLYNKITELANGENSNCQVFGDPLKLQGASLADLHPASWFSVAWYPIYRIPEGRMRAAFLTYHSLGYLVQRCITSDLLSRSPVCLALPVIGLQSYNAQGELWFSPNMEVKSAVGELASAVLKERLRTLEQNSLYFARGMVSKDHMTVKNRQPDYEFFMARKERPPP